MDRRGRDPAEELRARRRAYPAARWRPLAAESAAAGWDHQRAGEYMVAAAGRRTQLSHAGSIRLCSIRHTAASGVVCGHTTRRFVARTFSRDATFTIAPAPCAMVRMALRATAVPRLPRRRRYLRTSEQDLFDAIKNGIAGTLMPASPLPDARRFQDSGLHSQFAGYRNRCACRRRCCTAAARSSTARAVPRVSHAERPRRSARSRSLEYREREKRSFSARITDDGEAAYSSRAISRCVL